MKKILIFILLCLMLPVEVFPGGGSYYTRFGLGDFYYSYTARRLGYGELGIASIDESYLNNLNPAGWSRIRLTRFETGVIYRGSQETTTNSSAYYSQTVFSGMMIGFPVSYDNGVGVVAGIIPYSNVNYETAELIDSNVVDQYKLSYKGVGGLSKAFIGMSYRLPYDITIGSSFEYYTGKIEYSTRFDFVNPGDFNNASYIKQYYYHGIGFTVGAISGNFAKGLNIDKLNELRLGVTFSSQVSLATDSVSLTTSSIGTVQNSTESYKTKLPLRFGIGASVKWDEDYNFMLDYLYQPFSDFRRNGVPDANIRDTYKMSVGFEYRKLRPESQKFWEHVMLRTGLSFEQTQYIFNGEGINQASVYAGVSLPMGFDNSIDLGFMYGKRGTTKNNLLSENIYKFSISLSIGELWFVRNDR